MYHTLRHVASLPARPGPPVWGAALADVSRSLLGGELLEDRTCHQAGVMSKFCVCLNWQSLSPGPVASKRLTDAVLQHINGLVQATGHNPSPCVKLELAGERRPGGGHVRAAQSGHSRHP